MDDARELAGIPEDEIIASLFAAAERTRLPDEPGYDEAAMLTRFGAWLDMHTRRASQIEHQSDQPRKIQRRPSPPSPARYLRRQSAVEGTAAMCAAWPDVAMSPSMSPSRESAAASSTVQRLVLGSQLRRLRESHGITARQAARVIRGSYATIMRMEHGLVGFKDRDVGDLLTRYQVTDTRERAALLNLARDANTPGWWHAYADILPPWLEPYLALEAAASVIRTYQVQLVPELLQTEGYARAVVQRGPAVTDEEIALRSELRASRREIFRRPDAPQLHVILDENALRRPVGSSEVVREQLEHLIEVADHPQVTLQILPFSAGARSATVRPFTIVRFAEPKLADVVYIEQLTRALYLEKPAEVNSYLEVMEQLCRLAEPAAKTREVVSAIIAGR